MIKSKQSEIKKHIDIVLANNPKLKTYPIEAYDLNGVINLKGIVPSRIIKEYVEKLIRKQEGVNGVINELDVKEEISEEKDEILVPLPNKSLHTPPRNT